MQQLEYRLDIKDMERLKFYDKKADTITYSYRGKEVIGFKELVNKYSEYYMVIATSRFKKEIFCSLIKNKVDPTHIIIASECV